MSVPLFNCFELGIGFRLSSHDFALLEFLALCLSKLFRRSLMKQELVAAFRLFSLEFSDFGL